MHRYACSALAGAAALFAVAATASADDMGQMVLIPSGGAIQWSPGLPSLPKGVQIAILAGDPSKPGPFVLRVRAPANALIGPHTHATAENLTIISGNVFHQMGPRLDKSRG